MSDLYDKERDKARADYGKIADNGLITCRICGTVFYCAAGHESHYCRLGISPQEERIAWDQYLCASIKVIPPVRGDGPFELFAYVDLANKLLEERRHKFGGA